MFPQNDGQPTKEGSLSTSDHDREVEHTYVTNVTSSNRIQVTRRRRESACSRNSVHVSEGCEHLAVIHV